MSFKVLFPGDLPSLKNVPAVIIGNGPSRLQHNIAALKGRAVIFGCNRFFEEAAAFKGSPVFLGIQDDPIFRVFAAHESVDWLPLIAPDNPHPVTLCLQLPRIETKGKIWSCTGNSMAEFALEAGCAPVVLLGFGDLPLKEGGMLLDNVYNHNEHKSGRGHTMMNHSAKFYRFAKKLTELKQKNPKSLYRIRGFEPSTLNLIEAVDFDDLVQALPLLPVDIVTRLLAFASDLTSSRTIGTIHK